LQAGNTTLREGGEPKKVETKHIVPKNVVGMIE